MVNFSFIFAAIATFFVFVNAQTPTLPSNLGSFGSAIPTDISAAVSAASSLLNNPSAIQSIISQASAQASLIPSQYQSSYISIIAEASKSASAIQAKNTAAHRATNSAPLVPRSITFTLLTVAIAATFGLLS